MSRFQMDQGIIEQANSPSLQASAARCYAAKVRPLCLCSEPGVPMYIARVGSKFVIKRMPNSGDAHAFDCESYDPPPELSGLGEVQGSAIVEDTEEGTTSLKLDFALIKTGGKAPPAPSSSEPDTATTDGNKLTLRSTLHYLWEQAGFNRWAPSMEGKRNWFVIRKYLLESAQDKNAKGVCLSDMLFIPEKFSIEQKEAIDGRRAEKLSILHASPRKGARQLMIVIAEVKEIRPARYGYKFVFKHLPDFQFMFSEDLHRRLEKRFANELAMWAAETDTHLLAIGTFSIGPTGLASVEEVALMLTNDCWIPFEHLAEKNLLSGLIRDKRRFVKGMRYNLPSTQPLASVVLSDCGATPSVLYIVPPRATEDFHIRLNELTESSKLNSWVWKSEEGAMPPLPPKVSGVMTPPNKSPDLAANTIKISPAKSVENSAADAQLSLIPEAIESNETIDHDEVISN